MEYVQRYANDNLIFQATHWLGSHTINNMCQAHMCLKTDDIEDSMSFEDFLELGVDQLQFYLMRRSK